MVESQSFRGRLDDREITNMLSYACKPPQDNFNEMINRGLSLLALDPGAGSLDAFGISISETMTSTPFRELPAPRGLVYSSSPLHVQEATGSWNLAKVKFHVGATVSKWAIFVILDELKPRSDDEISRVWRGFKESCQKSGMKFTNEPPTIVKTSALPPQFKGKEHLRGIEEIKRAVKRVLRSGNPTFILVLLHFRDAKLYPGIKRICDVEFGVHSVTIVLNKVLKNKGPQQYYANVSLKLNQKLGGINHILDAESTTWLTKECTMLVGMDVTHPGPSSRSGTPSIAAVVATTDHTLCSSLQV